jgi:hypothetical protein
MLNLVDSALDYILLPASSIMWAAIQRKMIMHLTTALVRMYQKLHSRKYEPLNRSLTGVDQSETSEGVLSLSFYWVLHLSMYFPFVKGDLSIGPQSIYAIIISLVPLVIPYTFYLKWPVVSRGLLVCWAHIWLQDIYMWPIGMVSPLVYVMDL